MRNCSALVLSPLKGSGALPLSPPSILIALVINLVASVVAAIVSPLVVA